MYNDVSPTGMSKHPVWGMAPIWGLDSGCVDPMVLLVLSEMSPKCSNCSAGKEDNKPFDILEHNGGESPGQLDPVRTHKVHVRISFFQTEESLTIKRSNKFSDRTPTAPAKSINAQRVHGLPSFSTYLVQVGLTPHDGPEKQQVGLWASCDVVWAGLWSGRRAITHLVNVHNVTSTDLYSPRSHDGTFDMGWTACLCVLSQSKEYPRNFQEAHMAYEPKVNTRKSWTVPRACTLLFLILDLL